MVIAYEPVELETSDGRRIVLHESSRHHPDEFGLGAHHDGRLVGLLTCEVDDRRNGHVTVYVRPEWRNVGIGAALVRRMADRAGDLGVSYLTLSFGVENHAAAGMLAATGLVIARRVSHGIEKAAAFVPPVAAASIAAA
jgi:GNAT superfamily N-acetyltransferase